jgi:serine/threonine-protein kinase
VAESGATKLSRKIGRYEIVRSLGEGQYGAVDLAVGQVPGRGRQPGRRRVVAIKALKNQADPESAASFVQEFALLDQVKHRSIVRVFEYLEYEHAVVMEYVHGVTLRTVLDTLADKRDQIFTDAAVEICCEIADALFQAYTTPGDNGEPLQLVHRDLKPDNVMLTPNGEVKVLDWGLAKVDNAEFRGDSADQIKGTLLYMSPEQARGGAVDHRSDLFSLGLIMFEMLMREPLYTVDEAASDPLAKVMRDIENGDTTGRCAALSSGVPKVGPLVARALRTRPSDRFENGQELLVDLRRTLNRPRGVDLKEFCEYFFGQYLDLGDPPDPDQLGTAENQVGRLSIEERF